MSSLFGGQQITPGTVAPIAGYNTQQDIFSALLNAAGFNAVPQPGGLPGGQVKGVPGYGGPLSPNPTDTILPNVTNSWQPWDGGTSYIAKKLTDGSWDPSKNDPRLQQIMQNGGTGGPGNIYANLMAQYGTPSAAGMPLAMLAQNPMASPAASVLLPYMARGSQPYAPPMIPGR